MTLKEMREHAGLKQSDLSALSGVNLRSLQDYEQGHKSLASAKGETLLRLSQVLGYSIEDLLHESTINIELTPSASYAMRSRISAYARNIRLRNSSEVHFPVIEADAFVDMSQIYPTKQAAVKRVLTALRQDSLVESLRLFGSSISMACHRDSDIDLAVGLRNTAIEARNSISEKIQLACDWNADIIWMDHLSADERIYDEIMKGLVLI